MARLSSSTPHTTEMTKLVRYHAHLRACGAMSATPVAKERRAGLGGRHSEAAPDAAKATPKTRFTQCCRKPAKACAVQQRQWRGSARGQREGERACLLASKNHTSHGRRGRSVCRFTTSVAIAAAARPICTQMAKGPPSSEHSAASEEAAGDEEAAAAIHTKNAARISSLSLASML